MISEKIKENPEQTYKKLNTGVNSSLLELLNRSRLNKVQYLPELRALFLFEFFNFCHFY